MKTVKVKAKAEMELFHKQSGYLQRLVQETEEKIDDDFCKLNGNYSEHEQGSKEFMEDMVNLSVKALQEAVASNLRTIKTVVKDSYLNNKNAVIEFAGAVINVKDYSSIRITDVTIKPVEE